jgi:DNA-binding MarR family transcriptional regulator
VNESGTAELIATFLGSTQVFSRALTNVLEEEALHEAAEAQLTSTQAAALRLIDHSDCSTLSDLAALLDVSNAAASKMVDRLERRGLIARRQGKEDRRETELSLTDLGRRLLERYENLKTDMLARTFSEFPPEELRRTASLLSRLSATILNQSRKPDETCLQCYMYAREKCVAKGTLRAGCRNLRRLRTERRAS